MNGKEPENTGLRGFAFGISAYLMWGIYPFYFKAVANIPAIEVVAYRVLFSIPVAGIIILLLGRTADLKRAFKSPRTLALAAVTACLISINWGIYVWAIAHERTVESALGYYINPIVSIMLGALFLGERFNRLQLAAIALAVAAVVVLTVNAGGLPWVSLSLAFSFGFYGYFRKTLPIGPSQGFFLEVILLSVPSLIVVLFLKADGVGHFLAGSSSDTWLLVLAGPTTAIPLILYALGTKLLPLSTIGLMQYTTPTMIFLIAVFVFREPFTVWQLVAFCLIWTALALYSWSTIRDMRKQTQAGKLQVAQGESNG
ncbi:MAG: EamA family transporter RarD [Hyphomicrobiales bacterium]|nr:EamA family transporter RarD [Hyphomicrobiales bacterium]MCP5000689.1 EamA family transporter RarD [Hyphomicrobiales bacterium]